MTLAVFDISLLDPLDLRPRAVALHRQIPGVAQHAGRDPHLGAVELRADQFGVVGLAPDLAVVERVFAALAEAAERPGHARDDGFFRAEVEEATVFVFDLVLGLRGGFGGDGVDLAPQPGVELRKLLGAELVQPGGLELLGRHVAFDGFLRQRGVRRKRDGGEQGEREQRTKHRHDRVLLGISQKAGRG